MVPIVQNLSASVKINNFNQEKTEKDTQLRISSRAANCSISTSIWSRILEFFKHEITTRNKKMFEKYSIWTSKLRFELKKTYFLASSATCCSTSSIWSSAFSSMDRNLSDIFWFSIQYILENIEESIINRNI